MVERIIKDTPPRAGKRHASGAAPHDVAVHDIASPLGHETGTETIQGPPPGIPQVPGPGCSTEELRLFVTGKFQELAHDQQASENKILERLHMSEQVVIALNIDVRDKMALLEPLGAFVKDLDVITKCRNLATNDEVQACATAAAADLQVTRDKLDSFVDALNEQFSAMKALELGFKDHVANNFGVVERECERIKAVIQGVHDGAEGAQGATVATVHLQIGQIREELQALRAQGPQQQAQQMGINILQAAIGQLGGEQARIKKEVEKFSAALANHGQFPCHCKHLDEVDQRVVLLEQWCARAAQAGPSSGVFSPGAQGPEPVQQPDAWADYLRNSGHEAQGGGGGGTPPGTGTAQRVNSRCPDMSSYNLHKLFDTKVALSTGYQYDGGNAGEHWRRKIRGYMIATCPDVMPLLDWAEGMDENEITPEILSREASSHR